MEIDVNVVEVESVELVEVTASETVFISVEVGIPGPPGPPPPVGSAGDLHYTHAQAVPDTVWTVNHDMEKYPAIMCFDSAGDEIEGKVEYLSLNVVTVTFSSATGGFAYLN